MNMIYNSNELIEQLKKENYNIEVHQHQALFTVEDSKQLRGKISGAHSSSGGHRWTSGDGPKGIDSTPRAPTGLLTRRTPGSKLH